MQLPATLCEIKPRIAMLFKIEKFVKKKYLKSNFSSKLVVFLIFTYFWFQLRNCSAQICGLFQIKLTLYQFAFDFLALDSF